jgi:hypothetical protein
MYVCQTLRAFETSAIAIMPPHVQASRPSWCRTIPLSSAARRRNGFSMLRPAETMMSRKTTVSRPR